jgi:ATP-dependent helicase/nuclease subunit A
VRRAERILTRFQGTGLYADMAAAQRFHEVPYSVFDQEGRLEHGVIDALFREQAGWVLVEFKTDHVRGAEELEQKLDEVDYVPQVARYLAAAERLLGVRPRPVLCLLNYAGTVRLVQDRW